MLTDGSPSGTGLCKRHWLASSTTRRGHRRSTYMAVVLNTGPRGHVALVREWAQKSASLLHGSYVRTSTALWRVVSLGFAEPGSGSRRILPSVAFGSLHSELFHGGSVLFVKVPVTFPYMVTRSVWFAFSVSNEAST